MLIQPSEARALCSKSEWALLENSFSPAVEALPSSDLKSRIRGVRKLHQKSEDLIHRLHSDARKRTTRRKAELFAEAVGRFEAALRVLENAHSVAPVSRSVDNDKPSEETRTLNKNALQKRADQELERRKSHVLSAMAVRGEQQGGKSGSRRIQSHVGSATRRKQARRDTNNK